MHVFLVDTEIEAVKLTDFQGLIFQIVIMEHYPIGSAVGFIDNDWRKLKYGRNRQRFPNSIYRATYLPMMSNSRLTLSPTLRVEKLVCSKV